MKEPSMKWMLIAIIIGITTFLLAFNSYSQLLHDNGATISNEYTLKYQNITAYQQTYENWGEEITFSSILDAPAALLNSAMTSVTMGWSMINKMLTTLMGVRSLLNILQSEFTEFAIIIGLLITIFIIWVAYRALSEVRGTTTS